MAKTAQIITDRRTLRELVGFIEDAVREGLTQEEITSQVDLILDEAAKGRLERSLRELRRGRVAHFKDKEELLATLHRS
jgi:hypothetical protein